MIEPETLTLGDSAEWVRTVPGYPSSAWAGAYALFGAENVYSFATSPDPHDPDAHSVLVGSSVTAAWVAGKYDWTFYLTNKTDPERRITVTAGKITLLPNPATLQPHDGRSHAARMLDLIEAVLEGKASTRQLDTLRITHNNRNIEQNPQLLMDWRNHYRAEVRREQQQAALSSGAGGGATRLRVRF